MFTYLNSEKTRMFFNVELRKIVMSPLQQTSADLRVVKLMMGQPEKPSHEIILGVYKLNKGLLKGLASIDRWARDHEYITLDMIRKRLSDDYDGVLIQTEIKKVDAEEEQKTEG